MHQSNMGRSQEIISLEEYLQKRLAIREKESLENSHKKKRAEENTTALELAELLYV